MANGWLWPGCGR